MKQKNKHDLMVTQEAIEDFLKLSISERLRWLDEMRAFLSRTLPSSIKRNWKKV